MLSAIVLASDSRTLSAQPDAVVRTLSALVPAAIEGLVRDVTLAGLMGGDLGHIADHAGCILVESADPETVLRGALEASRGQKLFVIRAGRAPDAGYIEEIADFLSAYQAATCCALMRERPQTFLARTFPALAPAAGLVAGRDMLMRSGGSSLEALVRQMRPAVTLRARARKVD
ncbi:MAG: transposase [Beijerinckiaceae bacterium]|nr:transposase [Beijerinckiaceae bacterium]MDO9443422.1 transposase [Beijerinckiaceae bacterium]